MSSRNSRFPIVSGMQVQWDHTLPPGQRVKSIRLVIPPGEEEDEMDHPEDMIDFVEQSDGTRVEVNQKKVRLGEEVKNEAGGRVYRVVS
jgi:5'-nucleotidase